MLPILAATATSSTVSNVSSLAACISSVDAAVPAAASLATFAAGCLTAPLPISLLTWLVQAALLNTNSTSTSLHTALHPATHHSGVGWRFTNQSSNDQSRGRMPPRGHSYPAALLQQHSHRCTLIASLSSLYTYRSTPAVLAQHPHDYSNQLQLAALTASRSTLLSPCRSPCLIHTHAHRSWKRATKPLREPTTPRILCLEYSTPPRATCTNQITFCTALS